MERFQVQHSMEADGALGPATVKALNVPASYRAGQIAANLERIRWLPRDQRGRHLIINVPSFRLLMRDGTRTVSAMKVVVGADFRDRATPVFADSMSYVVFQPYWNVTASPAALTASAIRAGRVRVRQKPGGQNALGHAKFIFPNAFHIYLHDTPSRELFDRDVRAFSHGCIRVQRPAELASWVLGWDSTRVANALAGGRPNRYVPLTRKLPVYIIYLTAFTRDGELFFGNDLYSRDADLLRHVAPGALPDARLREALDRLTRYTTS